MTLDDERIERYSRQLILAEIGPRGQERMLGARVAVVGTSTAAECLVAYLAAAGIGWIAADAALHAAGDPDQPDVTLAPLADVAGAACDAAIVVAATVDAAADALTTWRTRAWSLFWIAAGRAGTPPPCPRCAAAATTTAAAIPPMLAALAERLLATVVATEVVKALLAIGAPLAGRLLVYDPATATVEHVTATGRCKH